MIVEAKQILEKSKKLFKMSLPKMYVNTCDATMFFIPIFNYFINKYFQDQEIVWLGFKKPDFPILKNQKYISLSPIQKDGVKNWATYLRTYFESIDDDIIFWGIDDHLIADHVDKTIINHLYKIQLGTYLNQSMFYTHHF